MTYCHTKHLGTVIVYYIVKPSPIIGVVKQLDYKVNIGEYND